MVQFARSEEYVAPEAVASAVIAVRATDDPQIIARVAGLLAQRSIIPKLLVAKPDGDRILLELQIATGDDHLVTLLLEKIRAMVSIERAMVVGS